MSTSKCLLMSHRPVLQNLPLPKPIMGKGWDHTMISASQDPLPRAHGCGEKGGYLNKNEFCYQGRGECLLQHSKVRKDLETRKS